MTLAVRFGGGIAIAAQREVGLWKDAKQSDAVAINADSGSVESYNQANPVTNGHAVLANGRANFSKMDVAQRLAYHRRRLGLGL